MSKSAVCKAADRTEPTTENETVSPNVIAFPAIQRWAPRDRRIYEHSCCSICGTGWGGAPGAARQGATCKASTCAACGSIVCQSHGLGNGRCPICFVGLLSGWGGNDKPCRYKGCEARAVAADGAWHVCAAHLERRKPDYVAARIAERDKAWELVPRQPLVRVGTGDADDADFVAAVRSIGASAYNVTVARYGGSGPTWQDEQETDKPAPAARRKPRRREPAAEGEPRRQYLTEREIEQLCDAARKRNRYGRRDATMILIAYRHGLRVSELVALQWAQLDLEAGRLQVIRRKGSDDSVQPLSGAEIRALRRIRREQPAGLRHVFVSERGAPFTANGFFKTSRPGRGEYRHGRRAPAPIAPCHRFQARQRWGRHPDLGRLSRASPDRQHGALHEDERQAVRRLLAGLIRPRLTILENSSSTKLALMIGRPFRLC